MRSGIEIYGRVYPFLDNVEEMFHLNALATRKLERSPNLRRVIRLPSDPEQIMAFLQAHGEEVEPL